MLVVYVVLLFAIPSALTIGGLGSLGKPSLWWGLMLLLWWLLSRMQTRAKDVPQVRQPLVSMLGLVIVAALIAFAAAMMRGQPADQVSPAMTALVRLASWSGVFLVAVDGIRTHAEMRRLVRALSIAGGALAALGLAQFYTGQSFVDWMLNIPGVSADSGGLDTRGGFARASGTATHPLEYATALACTLPLAIVTAIAGGFRTDGARRALRWWIPVVTITASSLVSVSRSAIIGLVVAVLATFPGVPRAYRWAVGVGGLVIATVIAVTVPGILTTMIALFTGAAEDPSTQSRTNALARVPEFISSSPVVGQGFGTFLPRYYIFDNQWVLLVVEIGILGITAFGLFALTAIGSAISARRQSDFADTKAVSTAFAASMLTIVVLFFFFDGLSFPIAAGLFFLIAGLCAAVRVVSAADANVGVLTAGLYESSSSRPAKPRSEPSA